MRLALPMIVLLVSIVPAALGADDSVIYSDDFSTLDPSWGDPSDQLNVASGKLVLKPQAGGSNWYIYQGTTFNDIDLTVKVSQTTGLSGSGGGIIFWGTDANTFYACCVQSDGTLWVGRRSQDKWLYPVSDKKPDSLKKGLDQDNQLRIVTQDKTATFYVNGVQIESFKGFPPDDGSEIGIYAQSGDEQCTWAYSNFVVSKPK